MAKTAKVYTFEELKEKAKKALENPKLVEIVKTAPLNKDGKVNLSWVYEEAEKYVHNETKDLQKTKQLAVATRFLAMLRRDHEKEFEAIYSLWLSQASTIVEPQKESKIVTPLWDEIFPIPHSAKIITTFTTRMTRVDHVSVTSFSIQFCSKPYGGFADYSMRETVDLILKILNSLVGTKGFMSARTWLTNDHLGDPLDCLGDLVLQNLIQLLEEKYGLKLKVCGNCRHYYGTMEDASQGCMRYQQRGASQSQVGVNRTCEYWAPKNVS